MSDTTVVMTEHVWANGEYDFGTTPEEVIRERYMVVAKDGFPNLSMMVGPVQENPYGPDDLIALLDVLTIKAKYLELIGNIKYISDERKEEFSNNAIRLRIEILSALGIKES